MEWSPDVSSALQFHRLFLGRPLLPNLQEFSLHGDQKNLFSSALFLPPTLKRISVLTHSKMLWTQTFLSCFPDMSPKLEHMEIFRLLGVSESVDIHPLLGCVHLRSLKISRVRVSVVESALHLAQLPNLEALSLSFIQPAASQNPSLHSSNPYIFQQLKSLECNSSPEFLQACRFPVLRSFSIREVFGIRESLDALWKHCSPNLLHDLDILCEEGDFAPTLALEDIQTVFRFPRLEDVMIRTYRCIWDDQVMELMASAWLGLRRLSISSNCTRESAGFTFLGLVHLAKCCPQLRWLSIPIRERNPPVCLSNLPDDGPSNFQLESASFFGGNIAQSQCETVAAFLSCLFPNLKEIWGARICFGRQGFNAWKSIEESLEKFATVRNYSSRRQYDDSHQR